MIRCLTCLCVIALWVGSCTKPVTIGSDFLEDEKSDLKFKDEFALTFYTEKTDSVIVHSGTNAAEQLITYSIGNVEDPIFGRYSTEIYAQPILPTIATQLIGSTLDSVVLQLRYDTNGTYGSISEMVTLEVYQMLENPAFDAEYYSNQRFMSSMDLLGTLTFVPKPKDSVTVITPSDTVLMAPHIRIPLDRFKLQDLLMQDSVVFQNQDSFLTYFKGLHIRMTGANNTLLGITLVNAVSGLTFYYDKDELMDKEFKFLFTSASIKTVYMEHDYNGSLVGDALSADPENDYWFVQGLSGVTTYMEVDGLDILGDVIINEADLEFYATFPDGDMGQYYPVCPVIITQEKTDTSLIYSEDVIEALSRSLGIVNNTTFEMLYGGNLEEVTAGPPAIYRYNVKLTHQVRDIYRGKQENIIYFNPFSKGDVPNRAVIFGPGHPTYAPRLRIYYTAL